MDESDRPDADAAQEPSVLPAREAMSLISPDSSGVLTPSLDAAPVTPEITEQAGGPGTSTAETTAGQLASDAEASESSEESTSSADQSTQISNQDTATSET